MGQSLSGAVLVDSMFNTATIQFESLDLGDRCSWGQFSVS